MEAIKLLLNGFLFEVCFYSLTKVELDLVHPSSLYALFVAACDCLQPAWTACMPVLRAAQSNNSCKCQ